MHEGKGAAKKNVTEEVEGLNNAEQDVNLDYYHVHSLEQLIDIMINPQKSDAYKKIRSQTMEQIGTSTLKASYQYKKELIANNLSSMQNNQTKKKRESQKKQISKFATGLNREAAILSEHTYE